MTVHPIALNVLSAHSVLASLGALGVFLILFAETGLLVGFFLPGDSLLFSAGVLCATKDSSGVHLSLAPVLLCAAGGALAGAQTGYLIGRAAGAAVVERGRSERVRVGAQRAEEFLDRYGYAKAIVLARFVPVVRTVLNPVAGILGVPARTFSIWQVIGGLGWSIGVTLAGYGIGSHVRNIDRYLLPIIAVIVVISLVPVLVELRRGAAQPRRRAHKR